VDPTAAPWRVLEDPADAAPASKDAAGVGSTPARGIPPTAFVTAGFAVLLMVGAFLLAFGSGSSGSVDLQGGAPLASPASSPGPGASASSGRVLVVEIVGAVDHPGVFRLPAESRVGDLVAAAGGYGTRVDASRAARELNLAATLHDGDQIRVPSRDDGAVPTNRPAGGGPGTGGTTGGTAARPIDLNRATDAELDALPGIGPVTAAKIIASREEKPFAAVDDLRTRKLVGEKTFAQLKDLVTVS
jgi:competence protein ComEA